MVKNLKRLKRHLEREQNKLDAQKYPLLIGVDYGVCSLVVYWRTVRSCLDVMC